MLLHHPPLLSSTLTSTVKPPRTHFTQFNSNPNLRSFPERKHNTFTQRASSSNPELTQIIENRIRAEDDPTVEDESFSVVSAIKTMYNDIFILDTKESMVLLLDETHNVHSIFYKGKQGYWTDSYWDEFAALPPIIPPGPIAIYGLGGGTAAHILLDCYPHLEIEGWEIDGVLVDKARDYLGLKELESINAEGGVLNVFVGDALTGLTGSSTEEEEKYAGIIVDLFSSGKVLDEMKGEEFWIGMKKRLRPGGRIMVNCGGAENVVSEGGGDGEDEWVVNSTVEAMRKVFNGELCWKKMPKMEGYNYMAVTGEMPDLEEWEGLVPAEKLKAKVWGWMPFPIVPMQ